MVVLHPFIFSSSFYCFIFTLVHPVPPPSQNCINLLLWLVRCSSAAALIGYQLQLLPVCRRKTKVFILFVIFLQKNAFNNNKRQFGQRSCKRNKATIVLKSFDCNWVLFSLNISMNTMKIFKGQCFLESTFYEE